MGEVLHEVDFNQLKIENQQYLEKIDEKNQELLRLKLMAGNTLQILNRFKVCIVQGSVLFSLDTFNVTCTVTNILRTPSFHKPNLF